MRSDTVSRGTLVLGLLVFVAIWAVVSGGSKYIIAPSELLEAIREALADPETVPNILASVRRLLLAVSGAYLVSVPLAWGMASSNFFDNFVGIYIAIALTSPGLAVAFVMLIIFGLSEAAIYIGLGIVVTPFIVLVLKEGFAARDPRLREMSRLFRFSGVDKLREVVIPEMGPFLYGAFRNGMALGWKVLVLFEIFSANTGIGFQYKNAFDFLDIPRLTTWMTFFLALVIGMEYGILRPIERRAFRWR